MATKQDSNATGLRYALETSLKVVSGSAVWKQFEPNSYGDFGSTVGKTRRSPINADRSNKKAVTTDLDATGTFNQDLTIDNTFDVLQGFFFADAREKPTTAPINGTAAIVITAATTSTYTAASGLTVFKVGAIVQASNFTNAANNGIKDVSTVAAGVLTVTQTLVAEGAPPATAYVETVGHTFAVTTMAIAMNGNLARLTSSAADLSTFGLMVGEWIYIGGDAAGSKFVNNQGYARISVINSAYLEFDKVTWATPVVEAATGITLKVYFGKVIKNELAALIKRRTYQVERTLGTDANGTMSEYLVGAVANELTITVPKADKVTVDLSFVAMDNEQRTGLTGVKGGTRPNLASVAALNTTSDVVRMRLGTVDTTTSVVTALFAYVEQLTVKISNGVTATKAIGVLGGFDTTTGNFDVSGSMGAFFADMPSVLAVRNNSDVTLDIMMNETNRGLLMDIPLIQLGNGRLTVEQDKAIMLPLDNMAAQSVAGHTMLVQQFNYLPNAAG